MATCGDVPTAALMAAAEGPKLPQKEEPVFGDGEGSRVHQDMPCITTASVYMISLASETAGLCEPSAFRTKLQVAHPQLPQPLTRFCPRALGLLFRSFSGMGQSERHGSEEAGGQHADRGLPIGRQHRQRRLRVRGSEQISGPGGLVALGEWDELVLQVGNVGMNRKGIPEGKPPARHG